MPYFVCARDGAGQIILKRDTSRDMGCFEVQVIAKAEQKAA
ncbi:hypothetical protein [Bradyrhizobium sp. WU425]|nr:hypothetical protein [Bradyrhizobium canariense]